MHDLLRLSCFKEELLRFFFKEIEDQIYAPITDRKLLYIATDNKHCMKNNIFVKKLNANIIFS